MNEKLLLILIFSFYLVLNSNSLLLKLFKKNTKDGSTIEKLNFRVLIKELIKQFSRCYSKRRLRISKYKVSNHAFYFENHYEEEKR